MTADTNSEIEILCPGVFAQVPSSWLPARRAVEALETLLSRAELTTERRGGIERNLCRRFGVEVADDGEVPAGALSLFAEGGAVGGNYWLRADPVHLHADRDRLVLFTPDTATRVALRASGYIETFNSHFSRDGWQLIATESSRWYLRAPRSMDLRTWPLREVDGRSVEPFLPWGPDAAGLRSLLTEAEMLMHALLTRETAGAPAGQLPNSLWLSGGGRLPARGNCGIDALMADDLVARGLARNAGITMTSAGQPLPPQGRVLCFLDVLAASLRTGNPAAYVHGLGKLNDVVSEALAQARSGSLGSLCVSDGDTRSWCARAATLKRWWRRRREYRTFLA